jgi:hypothetical protein
VPHKPLPGRPAKRGEFVMEASPPFCRAAKGARRCPGSLSPVVQRADEVLFADHHSAVTGAYDVDRAAWGCPVGRGNAEDLLEEFFPAGRVGQAGGVERAPHLAFGVACYATLRATTCR